MSRTPEPATPNRWRALFLLCAGQLMIILDGTIVSVALPAIQTDLGFTPSGLTWVVNSYLIPFAGLLLLAGRLGDLVGRRRMFIAGMLLFTAASLLCGLADSQVLLVVARFLQGVGGAMGSAVILGMIVSLFTERSETVRAMGIVSFVSAAGASIGIFAGGVLTDTLSWHWIFFVNVPIGLVIVGLSARTLVADRGAGLRAGADVVGATLVTVGLMLTVYTLVTVTDHGWGSAHTIGYGVLALGLLAGFVLRQATARTPLLPLRIFRLRNLTGANLTQVFMVAGMFGFQFLGVLYLQRVLGFGPMESGLALLPIPIVIAASSLGLSARLMGRFGARGVLIGGLVVIAVGYLLLSRAPVDGYYPVDFLPATLLMGLGFGTGIPALMTLAMSDAQPSDTGLASGLANTTQQVGGALGLSVLATVASSRTESLSALGRPEAVALTGGYTLAFTVGFGLVVAAIVVATAILRRPAAPETPEGEMLHRAPQDRATSQPPGG